MRENRFSGFSNRSDINWPALRQKNDRGLKFRIYEEEELYYQCSKYKGADQLCSYCTVSCAVTAQLICAFVFA